MKANWMFKISKLERPIQTWVPKIISRTMDFSTFEFPKYFNSEKAQIQFYC